MPSPSDPFRRYGRDPDRPVTPDDDIPARLIDALRAAPTVAERTIRGNVTVTGRLAARETELLNCLSHGMTVNMAAEAMGVSRSTAEAHRQTARFKLRAKTTIHAVATAIREGLIP